MNIETLIQAGLALSTIIGGFLAAYATYRSTNSSVKNEDIRTSLDVARVNKDLNFGGVESAERISNISLANAQFMQAQYQEAMTKIRELQENEDKISHEITKFKLNTMRVISKLRRLISEHNKLYEVEGSRCNSFQNLQDQLTQIIEELEQELSE